MAIMGRTALLAAVLATGACASTMGGDSTPAPAPDNYPVGTSGTTDTSAPTQVTSDRRGEIPVGQEMDVRLQTSLNSGSATTEERFEATTVVPLMQGDRELIPAGSTVRGVVSSVQPAGRVERTGRLTLAFDRIEVNGREIPMRAMATQVFESGGIRDEAKTVGTAGAVGAIVGGIIGGLKGALIGAAVGGGGVIAATEGKDVDLPAGTIVRLRLDAPLQVRR